MATPIEGDVTEQDIFASAMAPEPDESPEQEQPEAETPAQEGQPRDEHGRFAGTEPAPKAEPVQEPVSAPQDDRTGQIPAWRLKEEADARREAMAKYEAAERERSQYAQRLQEMERRIAEMQPKPEAKEIPDPLVDPPGYAKHIREEIQRDLENERRNTDLAMAKVRHGAVFDEAYNEARQLVGTPDGQQLKAMMLNAQSPGETLVQWYQARKVSREVGNDPNAWLEKKLEERLNDPAFLAKAMEKAKSQATTANGGRPNTAYSLPPSLSRSTRAGAPGDDDGPDDDSDAALLQYAMRR